MNWGSGGGLAIMHAPTDDPTQPSYAQPERKMQEKKTITKPKDLSHVRYKNPSGAELLACISRLMTAQKMIVWGQAESWYIFFISLNLTD